MRLRSRKQANPCSHLVAVLLVTPRRTWDLLTRSNPETSHHHDFRSLPASYRISRAWARFRVVCARIYCHTHARACVKRNNGPLLRGLDSCRPPAPPALPPAKGSSHLKLQILVKTRLDEVGPVRRPRNHSPAHSEHLWVRAAHRCLLRCAGGPSLPRRSATCIRATQCESAVRNRREGRGGRGP